MKTSIRLLLSALAVSCITLAAAGTPLPFISVATPGQQPALGHSEPTLPFEASLAGLQLDGRAGQTRLQ